MTTQTFDTWWKKLKPAECDELKQYFIECWNEAAQAQAAVEPYAYCVYFPTEQRQEYCQELDELCEGLTNLEHEITPLYTTPPDNAAAMRAALDALETAKNGLDWYRDMYPESVNGSDDEADSELGAAITQLRAALPGEQG